MFFLFFFIIYLQFTTHTNIIPKRPLFPPPPTLRIGSLLFLLFFFLLGLLWQDGKGRFDKAIRVVHLEVLAHELLLARLVGHVPADLVAVFFGLEEGGNMDARPHFFAAEFAVGLGDLLLADVLVWYFFGWGGGIVPVKIL